MFQRLKVYRRLLRMVFLNYWRCTIMNKCIKFRRIYQIEHLLYFRQIFYWTIFIVLQKYKIHKSKNYKEIHWFATKRQYSPNNDNRQNMILNDIWYVWIFGRHKHEYLRIQDACLKIEIREKIQEVTYQQHQCILCRKIVGLDDWQIKDLPNDMLYEKLEN